MIFWAVRVARIRAETGFSLVDFASIFRGGAEQSLVKRWERGQGHPPTEADLHTLARVLEQPASWQPVEDHALIHLLRWIDPTDPLAGLRTLVLAASSPAMGQAEWETRLARCSPGWHRYRLYQLLAVPDDPAGVEWESLRHAAERTLVAEYPDPGEREEARRLCTVLLRGHQEGLHEAGAVDDLAEEAWGGAGWHMDRLIRGGHGLWDGLPAERLEPETLARLRRVMLEERFQRVVPVARRAYRALWEPIPARG